MSVVMHTLSNCKYCDQAKDFLTSKQIPFNIILYDKTSIDYEELKNKLVHQTKQTTFPQIFVNDTFIGGFQDLIISYDTLKLHQLCEQIGITLDVDF
jgi:glutaredoxin 3